MTQGDPERRASRSEPITRRVGVVVPARNAGQLLGECLAAIRAQTHRPVRIVISVAPSEDDTAAIAHQAADELVWVIENPSGDRASGINAALTHMADADCVAMVDAQARLAPDYLERALAALERHRADVAGGPMRPEGRTAIGQAMAVALQSPFGIGDSQFHFAGEPREVDSVYLGVYRARVFEIVGRYNAALLRTEDDDMNARIRAAGMRVWLDPTIRSTYFCRDSLAEIWQQYHGYGYWKVALASVRPDAVRPRHVVPAALVLTLVVGVALLAVPVWLLPVLVVGYAAGAVAAALASPAGSLRARLLFPVVVLVMHLAYGLGSLRGAVAWRSLQRRARGGRSDA